MWTSSSASRASATRRVCSLRKGCSGRPPRESGAGGGTSSRTVDWQSGTTKGTTTPYEPSKRPTNSSAAPASPPLPILVLAQAPRPRRGRCAGAHPAAYMKKNLTENNNMNDESNEKTDCGLRLRSAPGTASPLSQQTGCGTRTDWHHTKGAQHEGRRGPSLWRYHIMGRRLGCVRMFSLRFFSAPENCLFLSL